MSDLGKAFATYDLAFICCAVALACFKDYLQHLMDVLMTKNTAKDEVDGIDSDFLFLGLQISWTLRQPRGLI